MITETLITILVTSVVVIFGILPNLPSVPESIINGINSFLDIIFNNLNLLNVFVPITTLKIVIPLVIVIINFDHIYKFVLWIIKKIPFLSME